MTPRKKPHRQTRPPTTLARRPRRVALSPLSDERPEQRLVVNWRRRWAELYDLAPVAYLTLDREGIIEALNLPAAALLGIERAHARGLPFRVFVVREDRGALTEHLARFKKTGSARTGLLLDSRKNGQVPVELTSRVTEEGPGLCFTAVTDMTDKQRSDTERRELEQAERVAREANKAKDDFLGMLSHELRTPLTPLLAAVSSLVSGRLSRSAMIELGQILRRNVGAEVRLIDDLLDVTRIENHKLRLQKSAIDVHGVVREALAMFADELQARRFEWSVELEATKHHVDGDPARLGQVFANLFKNGLKYTPDGGRLSVRSWNRGAAIVVEVSDSGEGIDEAALSRIFERFEQARENRSVGGGLGLGLAICRGIVELHGGRIMAHSPGRGRGSRFLVELETVAPPAVTAAGREVAPGTTRTRVSRKSRVLLVEDDPDIATTLAILLGLEGYEVDTKHSAAEALAADLGKVNVVVSDVGLPDLDGRELLARMRAKHAVKAIALSGYGTESDIHASLEAGYLAHLVKPVEISTLVDAIEKALASNP